MSKISAEIIADYDMQGKFIAEFVSIDAAEKATNTKGIQHVLKGKYKHANHFIWSKTKQISQPL